MKLNTNTVVYSATLSFLAVLSALTVLVALGKDPSVVLTLVGSTVPTLVASLAAFVQGRKTEKGIDHVKVLVNGNLERLANAIPGVTLTADHIVVPDDGEGPIPPGYEG